MGCAVEAVEQMEPMPQASADAAPQDNNPPDAEPAPETGALPTWALRDIQPQSPSFDQTYGLDAIPDKTIVALLVAGF